MHSISRKLISTLPFILLVVAARGQTSPATAVPAPSPADTLIILEHVVVTATPNERNQAEIASPVNVLSGRALALKLQPSLGETLAGQTGVASTYFGPGASRPIIRGLGGDRIRVLENGVGAIDASVASPDHAVSLDPLLIERVEIVRGPAALLYGGNAVGGVVNVIDNRILRTVPIAAIGGQATARASTVDDSKSAALLLEGGAGFVAWHADAYRRTARDVRIPGFTETASRRAEEEEHAAEEGEEPPQHPHGKIPNTSLTADGAAAGLSLVGKRGYIGFSASGHNTNYGVPPGSHEHGHGHGHSGVHSAEEEPGVRIDLKQRRLDVQGALLELGGFIREARFKIGLAEYRHQELEGTEIGTVFKNRGYDSRLELLHESVGIVSGALGAQVSHNDFSAIGEEAFVPPSHTATYSLFAFEEADLKPVTWQFGARVDRQEIEVRDGSGVARNGTSASLSTGVIWALNPTWSLGASLARSERQPNSQELYADGPHIGTNAFEIGDPTLGRERSTAIDVSLRKRLGFVTGELSVFAHRFDGYVFEQPTGEEEDGLPVFRYMQKDADFYGAELEAVFHLHEAPGHTFDLRVAADTVRGKLRGSSEALPRITPRRVTVGFDYRGQALSAGIAVQGVDRARHLAPEETATAGYASLSAYAGWRFALGRNSAELFVRGSNLTDQEARTHVSFLKDVAPLPGRDVTAGLRLSF